MTSVSHDIVVIITFHSLIRHREHAEQEMLTLPEHLISLFIEVLVSCHLCLFISCECLVFWILTFHYSICLIAWYLSLSLSLSLYIYIYILLLTNKFMLDLKLCFVAENVVLLSQKSILRVKSCYY